MLRYVFHRLALIPVTLLGITFLVFALSRFLPGGPLERLIWAEMQRNDTQSTELARLSDAQLVELQTHFGLEQDLLPAYGQWLWRLLQLDLGQSLRYQEPVWDLVIERIPVSLVFALSTLVFSYGFCLPLGFWLAYRPRHPLSVMSSGLILLLAAIPSYALGTLLFLYGAARWQLFPLGGLVGEDFTSLSWGEQMLDLGWHAALPLTAYLAGQAAVLTFMLRHQLEEHRGLECMRGARAKGASQLQALWHHALPLSILPVLSQCGNYLALLLAGSFVIERIFQIDGMGLLGYEALVERDYPLVLGILTLISFLHLIGNLISDLCLAWLDPRISWNKTP